MQLALVVHPVHPESSPGAEGMWRWAVHVGTDWSDSSSCLNAGAAADRDAAALAGQAVAVAAARVAERCGVLEVDDRGITTYLDHDPCGAPWPIIEVEEI